MAMQDSKHARELARVMREAGQIVPPELESMQSFGGGGGYGNSRYRSSGAPLALPGCLSICMC